MGAIEIYIQREREGERDRERDRQTDRQTERRTETERERDRETHREIEIVNDKIPCHPLTLANNVVHRGN